MKKEDLLSEEFLKQFKTGEELYSFLGQLQKRGVEAILEGELDNHLGYEKHGSCEGDNARNGHGRKRLRNEFGEAEIRVPRDRQSTLNLSWCPRRNIADGVESIIISMQRNECW